MNEKPHTNPKVPTPEIHTLIPPSTKAPLTNTPIAENHPNMNEKVPLPPLQTDYVTAKGTHGIKVIGSRNSWVLRAWMNKVAAKTHTDTTLVVWKKVRSKIFLHFAEVYELNPLIETIMAQILEGVPPPERHIKPSIGHAYPGVPQ